MKRKVALTGFKRTGKDYVAENFFKDYRVYRIADNIKLSCIKAHSKRWDDFLVEDDRTYTDLINTWTIIETPNILPLRFISSLELSDEDLLNKMNLYKTISGLKTRVKIYEFLEIQDKEWYDYWIKETIKDIEKLEENIIVTDCRMLIEAIDFLLNDFFILSLYNSRVVDIRRNLPNWLFHSTELQLWILGEEGIWYSLDVTSRDTDYLQSIVSEIIELFYKTFNGYSIEFKEELQSFRKYLVHIIPVLEKQIDEAYSKKDFETYNLKLLDIKELQSSLREQVRKEYQKHIIF